MKNQFVTYEIAKELKELGFNEPCFAHFNIETEYGKENPVTTYWHKYDNRNLAQLTAPLWQQAINFLEKEFKVFIGLERIATPKEPKIYWLKMFTEKGYREGAAGNSLEQAILKAIEILKK
jgi:hypothetical protein